MTTTFTNDKTRQIKEMDDDVDEEINFLVHERQNTNDERATTVGNEGRWTMEGQNATQLDDTYCVVTNTHEGCSPRKVILEKKYNVVIARGCRGVPSCEYEGRGQPCASPPINNTTADVQNMQTAHALRYRYSHPERV